MVCGGRDGQGSGTWWKVWWRKINSPRLCQPFLFGESCECTINQPLTDPTARTLCLLVQSTLALQLQARAIMHSSPQSAIHYL